MPRGWVSVEYAWRIRRYAHGWHPPTDLFETEHAYVVLVEIPGMQADEFDVTFERGKLTIRGNRRERRDLGAYHQMEIAYGEFLSEVALPGAIDPDGIEALYQDGFLRVIMPKKAIESIETDISER